MCDVKLVSILAIGDSSHFSVDPLTTTGKPADAEEAEKQPLPLQQRNVTACIRATDMLLAAQMNRPIMKFAYCR